VASGNTSIFDILGQFTLTQLMSIASIVKVFIDFSYRGETVNVDIHGSFGLKVVTDDAMGVPTVPLPRPADDPDSSWLFIKPYHYLSAALEQVHRTYVTGTSRRLPTGSTLAWVLASDATSGGTVRYEVNLRTLIRMK